MTHFITTRQDITNASCLLIELYTLDVAAQSRMQPILDELQSSPLYRQQYKRDCNKMAAALDKPYIALKHMCMKHMPNVPGIMADIGTNFERGITMEIYNLHHAAYDYIVGQTGEHSQFLSKLIVGWSMVILAQNYAYMLSEKHPHLRIAGDGGHTVWERFSLSGAIDSGKRLVDATLRHHRLPAYEDGVLEDAAYGKALMAIVDRFEDPDFMYGVLDQTPNIEQLLKRLS